MKILHISLTAQGKDYVSLRYFWDNSNDYQEQKLPLSEIKDLIEKAETDYYTRLPVEYSKTGQRLYNWLDGSQRLLAKVLQQCPPQGLILAIATDKNLDHLPWELLHDGKEFLIEKRPPVVPVRWLSNGQPIEIINEPQNRPLNVCFMATSPRGVEPELDYEAEEGQILEATKRSTIDLRVEESGWLEELGYVVKEYEAGYFDIFHLTGHASYDQKPYFLTEDEYGNRVESSASDIYDAFEFNLPSLIFLSGCRTGYSNVSIVPSMAQELLGMGAKAVMGWGERVRDTDAIAAASVMYRELAQGSTLTQALSLTYKALLQEKVPDWHKLRLYVSNSLIEGLVTPLRTRGRKKLPKPTTTIEFRDDEDRLRVAKREEFVGRRRQLQNCLRTLKTDFEKVGVLIHGMGGWGKSSIASRLWDRLADHEKILWWRQIDEAYLIKKLKTKLIKPEQIALIPYLENKDIPLTTRFVYLFNQLGESGEKPLIFLLDDFEWNLEPREGRYILKAEVTPVLEALVTAIQETGFDHRIIITCRYEFHSELLDSFFKQGLEPLRKSELTKKLNRLQQFNSDKITEDVKTRALSLADGNPRLLEFLNDEVLGQDDVENRLTELEHNPEQWKKRIVWPELYQLIDPPLQKALSQCLVYEIPVPMTALEAVADSEQIQRGKELGLIEVSSDVDADKQVYSVPQILTNIISEIQLPEIPKVYSLYERAYDKLRELWSRKDNESEEKWQEIFRLLFANKDNSERFRQGFSEMLAVQYGLNAEKSFKYQLRQSKQELPEENLCEQLKIYLEQKDWRKADEETTFLFYVVMVQQNFRGWGELCEKFPSQILNEIDQLWVSSSQGHFGFSVQKQILESIILKFPGGMANVSQNYNLVNYGIWSEFGEQIEWKNGDWKSLLFSTTAKRGNLPALYSATKFGEPTNLGGGRGGMGIMIRESQEIAYLILSV